MKFGRRGILKALFGGTAMAVAGRVVPDVVAATDETAKHDLLTGRILARRSEDNPKAFEEIVSMPGRSYYDSGRMQVSPSPFTDLVVTTAPPGSASDYDQVRNKYSNKPKPTGDIVLVEADELGYRWHPKYKEKLEAFKKKETKLLEQEYALQEKVGIPRTGPERRTRLSQFAFSQNMSYAIPHYPED